MTIVDGHSGTQAEPVIVDRTTGRLLIPLVFGLGGPLVAPVGTNIGTGRRERVVRSR